MASLRSNDCEMYGFYNMSQRSAKKEKRSGKTELHQHRAGNLRMKTSKANVRDLLGSKSDMKRNSR